VNLFAYSNFVSGDFMLTLGVARYEPAAVNYNRLCLAVWDDYDNNVRFDYGYGNGRGLELVGEQAQVVTGGSLPVDFTNQPFLLRLVKRGGGASDLYTAYYSTNGVDFLAFANNSVANGNGQPSKLGFWFGDDPNLSTHAWLDYFEVVALPPATNMQAYTDTFTPGSGAASWRVQNNAKLYTIDQSQGALAMSKASGGGGGGGEWAVAYSAVTASGDFDVRADYREAGLTYTGGGWGNQIQLNVVYGGQAFCVVRGNEPNYGGNNAHVWDSQAGGQGIVAASDTNGTLRVIRTGTLMKGYHNNTFLWQRTCNTNLATIYLSLQNNGTADPISVKFDNFHVSAQAAMLAAPAFTSAALTAGMLGSPFVWQVTADYWSGLSAAGLPPGLIMNASGLITGTPTGGGAFNATITATNAQVATTQPLRIVISDGVGMLWREDFNNGLAANWTTLPTDASYYSFPPGQMNLRANYGDTWTYYNRPLNLFALNTPTAGDFMVTLGVSKYDLGDRNYPGIFLVAWDDTDNNVRLGYQASTGSRSSSVSIESGQTMTYSAGTSIDFATNAFVLRLVKQGNLYSGWWSTNGTDFLSLGGAVPAPYGNGLPAQVGFWMGVDPTLSDTMLIDYFEVSALTMTNAGTPPVFASANLTGALQGAPFAWEVNADYATGFGASGLPPGLAIGPGGLLTGTPAASGVYDSIVTATNAFGSANQTLRIVVRNPTGVLFRDDFSSGLSSSWTTVPSDTSYFNLLPGQMRARADYGEAWSSINRPLHLFAVDAPTNDDFTITLGVSKFVPNHADSPQVGVIAWQDTDNYVRSIYYGSYWGPSSQGQMVIEQGASPIPTQFPLAFGDQPFLLRLQRTNGVYTSSWSTNGVDFTFNPGTASSATLAPTKLGFYLGGDPTFLSVAVVDHFELASGAANPVAPPPPLLQFLRASSDTIAFSWSAAAGYNYQVQYTTNLGTGPWLNLGGPLPGNNGTLSVSNTVNLARQRFYRLLAQ